ncbi:MAG TPA: class I SAM-dependent methyltransferase [Dehalococcoidia bacterium]|jgi:SAM-dependent methyltransferase|nr:class I SAM-dependent methyltransferase [Dehalococcoidia bacterium]
MTEDPYAPIARLYDLSYGDFTEDVDFYENLAQISGGPVLELGVGTGRVSLPLARAGYEVVGLDGSQAMLAEARRNLQAAALRKGLLELVEGDMRSFDLGRRFGLVFVAANTFQHLLTTAEQTRCIECVARHLQPGGVFAMSIRSPASVSWEVADGWAPALMHWTRTDPESGDLVMKFCVEQPEPERMVRRLTYFYDTLHDGAVHRDVFVAELRYSTQAEIELLLQQQKLRVTHVYGDYDLSAVGFGDNLIFVARS